jgi:hypothetical protein
MTVLLVVRVVNEALAVDAFGAGIGGLLFDFGEVGGVGAEFQGMHAGGFVDGFEAAVDGGLGAFEFVRDFEDTPLLDAIEAEDRDRGWLLGSGVMQAPLFGVLAGRCRGHQTDWISPRRIRPSALLRSFPCEHRNNVQRFSCHISWRLISSLNALKLSKN